MTFAWRWLKRLVLVVIGLTAILLLPVGYVEVACRGPEGVAAYQPIVAEPAWQRAESRTLTTYPEWHIVHAYDDYAEVISKGDPHDFEYLRAIAGFWTSLCPLKAEADSMGGMTGDQKMTIYTIGVSFSAELLAKAAYEESAGRIASVLRGAERSELDDVSARQARDYAKFLQQVPWYEWDFVSDVKRIENEGGNGLRDRERRFALRNEFLAKAWYARFIASAVENMEADALRLRSVVSGASVEELEAVEGVIVIEEVPAGVVVETDRYRAFTNVAKRLAQRGVDFVEIAGNSRILVTAISDESSVDGSLHSFRRQGYYDWRHLVILPVSDLAAWMRAEGALRLEHVHDY